MERWWKNLLNLEQKSGVYLMGDDTEHEKAKGIKKSVIKRELMFKNYTNCLFNDKNILKSHQIFKSIRLR